MALEAQKIKKYFIFLAAFLAAFGMAHFAWKKMSAEKAPAVESAPAAPGGEGK